MADLEKDLIFHHNIAFAPILHGKFEFGVAVRRLFYHLKPDAVAVELPRTIQAAVEQGLDRLPYLSVVMYPEEDGRFVYLPLEPHDPVMVAAWLARRHEIPLFFIDRDTEGYPHYREAWPDSYSIQRLGLKTFAEAVAKEFESDEPAPQDRLRELTQAFHLSEISRTHQRVLCVLGAVHYERVKALLDQPLALPLARTRRKNVSLANLARESSREILSEMPFLIAEFVRSQEKIEASDEAPDFGLLELDRLDLHHDLIDLAKARHLKNAKEEISPAQKAVLFKFARNQALVNHHLTPDLYQLLVAARGAVNDNYAYEVWDIGTDYPWQEEESALPTLRLKGEDLYLDTKKIRFYRRFRHFRRRLVSVPIKKRKREKNPGEWKKAWTGQSICSYQPEDLVIEGFGDYMKKKTLKVLSEENRRVAPFSTSMLDGLDIRETIRNWHEGKLYVAENRQVKGKVGSVVLIFDYDDQEGRENFPWKMTWLGEHEQESDMAFYSTPAGENVIGPGISRCEYGGFMLTYPPLRLYDIWRDTFFDRARNKAERLLFAAVDYSEERLIAYVAAKPPSEKARNFAAQYGKKIVYLPLGQFSPVTLKKVRTFHVLDGRQVRHWAPEFIY